MARLSTKDSNHLPALDSTSLEFIIFYTLFLGIHVLAQELDWPLYYMTDFFRSWRIVVLHSIALYLVFSTGEPMSVIILLFLARGIMMEFGTAEAVNRDEIYETSRE